MKARLKQANGEITDLSVVSIHDNIDGRAVTVRPIGPTFWEIEITEKEGWSSITTLVDGRTELPVDLIAAIRERMIAKEDQS